MTDPSRTPARASTVDIAKGLAIVTVVFSHVTLGLQAIGSISSSFMNWSTPFYLWYMCIFFFASGLFVDRSLSRDGASRFIGKKALELGYPFLVWSLIFGLSQMIFSHYTNTGSMPLAVVMTGLMPWAPREHMWFLPALFIAFAVTAVCYRFGRARWRWILLVVALLMLITAPLLPAWNQRLQYTWWMALGVLFANSALRQWLTAQVTPRATDVLVLFGTSAAFVATVIWVIGPRRTYYQNPATLVLAASLGILSILALSRLLSVAGSLATLGQRLGKWSLYIYLTHVPILALVRVVMTRALGVESVAVITSFSVAICIGVGCVAGLLDDAGRLPWVFRLPDPLILRLSGARPRAMSTSGDPLADR